MERRSASKCVPLVRGWKRHGPTRAITRARTGSARLRCRIGARCTRRCLRLVAQAALGRRARPAGPWPPPRGGAVRRRDRGPSHLAVARRATTVAREILPDLAQVAEELSPCCLARV